MGLHVARLDRAGMGAQQHLVGHRAVRVLQIKRVVHRTRRVILGRVQGREIEKVFLDFGAVGHFEADRAEQRLDALQRPRHRMQAAAYLGTAGQRDIQRLFRQACDQRRLADRFAPLVQCSFDSHLGHVDRGAGRLFLFRRQLAQPLEQFGDLPALAEETGFHLFQRIRVGNGSESHPGFANDLIEIFHGRPPTKPPTKKEARASFL